MEFKTEKLSEEELRHYCADSMSYAFNAIREAPQRFGQEWKHSTIIRKLIEEAFLQGILYYKSKVDKDGEQLERQEEGKQNICSSCGG